MKYFIGFIVVFLFASCSATAPPTKEEVKQMVAMWYQQESSNAGAGRWEVKEINVVSITNDINRKKIFHTVSLVNGTYHSPGPDEPFSDTLRMALTWNGAKWITAE